MCCLIPKISITFRITILKVILIFGIRLLFSRAKTQCKSCKSIAKVIPHRSKPVFITVVMNVRNGRYEHRFRPMRDDLTIYSVRHFRFCYTVAMRLCWRSRLSFCCRRTPRMTRSPTLGYDGMCLIWWRTMGMSHSSMSAAKKSAAMSVQPKSILTLCARNPSTMPSIICPKSAWLAERRTLSM